MDENGSNSRYIKIPHDLSSFIRIQTCPNQVKNVREKSVEVLIDTPPGSPKNCPEARGGSVRVQISPSRPVSIYMVKPRFCPMITRRCNVAVARRTLGYSAVTRRTVGRGRLKVPSSGLYGRKIGYCR
ncbi:hypothetical protein YC2023_033330 [Brassica napus]